MKSRRKTSYQETYGQPAVWNDVSVIGMVEI